MKKLLVLSFLLLSIGFIAQAQFTFKITEPVNAVKFVPVAADSLYTSAVKTFVFILPQDWGPTDYVISYKTTQVRGTAAYTSKLEESVDGVNYFAITNADNDANSGGGNYTYAWRSASDTAMVTGRYVKITMTATSAAQNSTIALNALFTKKRFR